MIEQSANEPVKTINPRSSGVVTAETYSKTSKEISLAVEASELQRCAALDLGPAYIHTAELVSFDKETNTLATKKIAGRDLFLTMWNPTSLVGKLRGKRLDNAEVLLSRVAGTGKWLSQYHQTTTQNEGGAEASKWLTESFLSKTKGIRDNNLMNPEKLARIEKRFLGEIANLADSDYRLQNNLSLCQIHGDFIVYNMLVDANDEIHIIDFGDSRIAANVDDVARFYSNMWAIAQTNGMRKKAFGQTLVNFLSAYGLEESAVETPYFEAMMAYNFLIHLYGQFIMRDLLSFYSNYELGLVTQAGLKWIDNRI